MKKKLQVLLLFVLTLLFTKTSFSQGNAIGFHLTTAEYKGDLSNNKYSFYKFRNFKAGLGISAQQFLNSSFNLVELAGYNRVQYFRQGADLQAGQPNGVDADFYNFNVLLKYKFNNGYILKNDPFLAPYVIAGLGVNHIRSTNYTGPLALGKTVLPSNTKPTILGGVGLYFRFNEFIGIDVSTMMNQTLTDDWDGIKKGSNDLFLQHSIGFVFSLAKSVDSDKDGVNDKNDICPNTPAGVAVDSKGCPLDVDNDGVPDYKDKCPKEFGSISLDGCPDKDNDGITDAKDKCPTVAGVAKFDGCPDTDGDGVEDTNDKCPNTKAGVAVDSKGCPLDGDGDNVPDYLDKCPDTKPKTKVDADGCPLDSDGDGVVNNVDKCPNTAGPASNNGCPVVKEAVKKRLNYATKGIYFETGKSIIKPESYAKLDEIVSIINEYPDYKVKLTGHTDDVGTEANNMKLSQARVDAVKSYLVSKNVPSARVETLGYGEVRPIASNKTAAGKAQNRRVELELSLK